MVSHIHEKSSFNPPLIPLVLNMYYKLWPSFSFSFISLALCNSLINLFSSSFSIFVFSSVLLWRSFKTWIVCVPSYYIFNYFKKSFTYYMIIYRFFFKDKICMSTNEFVKKQLKKPNLTESRKKAILKDTFLQVFSSAILSHCFFLLLYFQLILV